MKSIQSMTSGQAEISEKRKRKFGTRKVSDLPGRFPMIEGELRKLPLYLREIEQGANHPVHRLYSSMSPGVVVRHRHHPEYGLGRVVALTQTRQSAYCRFDQYSYADSDWTPSGMYPVHVLEVVETENKIG